MSDLDKNEVSEGEGQSKLKKKTSYAKGFSTVRVDADVARAAKFAALHFKTTPQKLMREVLKSQIQILYLEAFKNSEQINLFANEENKTT